MVLKTVFIDTVYMNVMQLESESEGPDYMLCESIEDYMKYEQHSSCLVNRVQEEDLICLELLLQECNDALQDEYCELSMNIYTRLMLG
jgi:hypothetical protein